MDSSSPRRLRMLVLAVALYAACGLTARSARSQSLSGKWTASPLTTRWVIGEWGKACGPKPSGGGAAGGTVTIQHSGNQLTITGSGRTYSTKECWERYPGLRRVSHSSSSSHWKTVCRTSPSDARQATLTTTLSATADEISFYEAGQYQFVIKGQNCTASVGRYRTYRRVGPAAGAEPSDSPARPKTEAPREAAKPARPCAELGAPARLEVRPARKLMRPGETFSFRASVADAKGCPLGRQPAWEIVVGAEHATIVSPGTVRVSEDAPEGEVEISVSIGGKSTVVTAEVASKERYEALLAGGSFNESGEVDETASIAIASESVGAETAVAEDARGTRKILFVAGVGGVALLLGLVGLLFVRRSRRAQAAAQAHATAEGAPFVARAPEAVKPPEKKKICPVCGSHYPADSQFCGNDGAALMPLN